jgi:hypothetical protein
MVPFPAATCKYEWRKFFYPSLLAESFLGYQMQCFQKFPRIGNKKKTELPPRINLSGTTLMEHKDCRIIWKVKMHRYLQRSSENCKDYIHDLGSSVALLQDQLGTIPYPQRVAAKEEPHDRAHAKPAGKSLPDAGLVSALQGLVVLLHCPFLTGERCDLQHKEQG